MYLKTYIVLVCTIQLTLPCPPLPEECVCDTSSGWSRMVCNLTRKNDWPVFNASLQNFMFESVEFSGPTRIKVVTEEALKFVRSLSFNLSSLGLEGADMNVFTAHKKLGPGDSSATQVFLENNQFEYFPSSSFKDAIGPFDIFMGNNQIKTLSEPLGSNVRRLDLARNNIESISDAFFAENNSLFRLDISHNTLRDEAVLGMTELKSLGNLNLSYNKLTTSSFERIYNSIWKNDSWELDLSNNDLSRPMKISSIDVNSTLRMCDQNILKLNLAHTKLKIFPTIVTYIICLGWVDIDINLSGNSLTTFPVFRHLYQHSAILNIYVTIDNNPLHCDCSASWVRMVSFGKMKTKATCWSPPSVYGYHVQCFPLTSCKAVSGKVAKNAQGFCDKERKQIDYNYQYVTPVDIYVNNSMNNQTNITSLSDQKRNEEQDGLKKHVVIAISVSVAIILLIVVVAIIVFVFIQRKKREKQSRREAQTDFKLLQPTSE